MYPLALGIRAGAICGTATHEATVATTTAALAKLYLYVYKITPGSAL